MSGGDSSDDIESSLTDDEKKVLVIFTSIKSSYRQEEARSKGVSSSEYVAIVRSFLAREDACFPKERNHSYG